MKEMSTLRRDHRTRTDRVLQTALAAFVILRYASVLSQFWLFDDPLILKHAILYRPWEYFFIPEVWQKGTVSNFTPWVLLSFDVDNAIFGIEPRWYYLHHLMSLSALAAAAYIVLRSWLPQTLCFFVVLIAMTSLPIAEASGMLMLRHYAEGMVLALLSTYAFVKSVRDRKKFFGVLGAATYLLAVSAKEIYVPLIFVLLLLPESSIRCRMRALIPWFIVLLLYIPWRWYMLGRLVGGYGIPLNTEDIQLFLPRVAVAMGSNSQWWIWFVAATTLAAFIALLVRGRSALLRILLSLPLTLLPILPVSSMMASRYVWLPYFSWIIVQAVALDALTRNARPGHAAAAATVWGLSLLVLVWSVSSDAVSVTPERAHRHEVEGVFVLRGGTAKDLLVNPASSGWYYMGLSWLRKKELRLAEGPAVTWDATALCTEMLSGQGSGGHQVRYVRVWHFEEARRSLAAEDILPYCKRLPLDTVRKEASLSFSIDYRDAVLSWEFGPYGDGTYTLLLGASAESPFQLSRRGRAFISLGGETLFIRLKYASPEGWVTYSEMVKLAVKGDRGGVQWKR